VNEGFGPELLVEFSVLLTTSVAAGAVTEAFSVHEISRHSAPFSLIEDNYAELDLTQPVAIGVIEGESNPFIGPEPDSSPIEVIHGNRLLQLLALSSREETAVFFAEHPHAVDGLLERPPRAMDVSIWWNSMTSEHQLSLRELSPRLVGNLDGIPFSARDLANRANLAESMAELESTIASEPGRTIVENAKYSLRMLTSIASALESDKSRSAHTLVSLDTSGQGRAAIVVGNLRTADYVTYLVPGMFFTIENQMGDWVGAATRLHDEQLRWLDRFDEPASTVATVAWIGYHTPNLTNVGAIDNAYEGRDSLANAIRGLQAVRAGDEPFVTIVAHSYGSTAALMALSEFDFTVDALAMVGSPGSPAKSVEELHVRRGNVYVGEAAWDPIPNSSYFGSDPGAKNYGAKPLGVSGGVDAITHDTLLASTGHNEYFSADTESMRNFALIGIGRGAYVSAGGQATAVKAAAHGR
jgi:pimeloyl-ACP methyl ester carboxylesterase